MFSRRSTLIALSCTCCKALAFPPSDTKRDNTTAASARGCGFDDAGRIPSPQSVDSTSGLGEVDKFIAAELIFLKKLFRVRPNIEFFDDAAYGQAFALRDSATTIAIGRNLLKLQLKDSPNSWRVTVAGILAHEWNHAYQYSHVLQENVFLWETHSDYMAGWYLGSRYYQQGLTGFPEVFATLLSARGASAGYFDPDKHGQPNERVTSMLAGFKYGLDPKSIRAGSDVDTAAENGYVYAKTLR